MKLFVSVILAIGIVSVSLGQCKSAVTSSAGFVSAIDTTSTGGSWTGITGGSKDGNHLLHSQPLHGRFVYWRRGPN